MSKPLKQNSVAGFLAGHDGICPCFALIGIEEHDMHRTNITLALCLFLFCFATASMAQQAAAPDHTVPSLVKFSGTLTGADGKPLTGVQGVIFLLYKEETGGVPLWMETQNVQADRNGRYSVMLGAANAAGLPAEVFVSGEARWLGVQASGQAEQARTLLLSVPYALKAGDAETLGGKPASAFLTAPGSGATSQAGAQPQVTNPIGCASGTACKSGFVPVFSSNGGSAKVTDSIIKQSSGALQIAGSASATGSISAGGDLSSSADVNANGNLNANGNVGASSVTTVASVGGVNSTMTGSADGIGAVEGFATATGAAGFTFGVIGQSASDAGRGVWGFSPGAKGVGVIGEATGANGIGMSGKALNGTGWAYSATGNAQQDRTSGGWVKAMVYFSGMNSGRIVSCYNSTLSAPAATTPPCGFAFTKTGTGSYILDFGFEIDDRFFSLTQTNWFATSGICTDWNGGCSSPPSLTPNQMQIYTFLPGAAYNNYFDTKFYVMVF
jgi:hypothetical protein